MTPPPDMIAAALRIQASNTGAKIVVVFLEDGTEPAQAMYAALEPGMQHQVRNYWCSIARGLFAALRRDRGLKQVGFYPDGPHDQQDIAAAADIGETINGLLQMPEDPDLQCLTRTTADVIAGALVNTLAALAVTALGSPARAAASFRALIGMGPE